METLSPELTLQTLRQLNPWWSGAYGLQLPLKRTILNELKRWMIAPPTHRAILLTGARRVGKTTLLHQIAEYLINDRRVAPSSILYLALDHPILKLSSLETLLEIYEQNLPQITGGIRYLAIDEIQYASDWASRLKHLVDRHRHWRIIATGSAISLRKGGRESGVGRWHRINVPTLSFYEYSLLRDEPQPSFDQNQPNDLESLFEATTPQIENLKIQLSRFQKIFADYLLRGGFPESALMQDDREALKVLREDIVDKVLKKDLTEILGARNVDDVEKLFLYLCLNLGAILESNTAASFLGTTRESLANYLGYLEDANLIYKLWPFKLGGKRALKAKFKYYLADPSLANAILLRGREFLEDPEILGKFVENAVFKHIFARYYSDIPQFGYWINPLKDREVDIIVKFPQKILAHEVKFRHKITTSEIRGLLDFIEHEKPERAYLITRELDDFGIMKSGIAKTPILRIPAFIFCYLCGLAEAQEHPAP